VARANCRHPARRHPGTGRDILTDLELVAAEYNAIGLAHGFCGFGLGSHEQEGEGHLVLCHVCLRHGVAGRLQHAGLLKHAP